MEQTIKSTFSEVLEELEINSYDYHFRQSIKGWNKKYHQFLMLDLRAYMLRKFKGEEPCYKGNIYSIRWFSPVNFNDFADYFHRPERYVIIEDGKKKIKKRMVRICEYSDEWEKYKHIPQIREYYKNKTGNDNPTQEEYKDWGESKVDDNKWFITMREHFKGYSPTKTEKYTHSKRVATINFNYKKTPFKYESVLNYKKWDKETKKTSLKGLKADTRHTWTYTQDKGKTKTGGWTFDGFEAISIEKNAILNGFKKEKGKKYSYGHYGDFLMKC